VIRPDSRQVDKASQDLSLSMLRQCVVLILKPISALRLKNLVDTRVYAAAVSGSIQIDNCVRKILLTFFID